MKKLLYILTFLLLLTTSYSQKEYHNWVFGNGCYVTFNTDDGEPEVLDEINFSVLENSSVVSNEVGELQFYSGDKYLYYKNYRILNFNVDGNYSSFQGGCLFRVNKNHYVRVGSNFAITGHPPNPRLSYTDIYINDYGPRASKRRVIDSTFYSEGLLLLKSQFNNQVYLVVSDSSDNGTSNLCLYKYSSNRFELIQTLNLKSEFVYHQIKYNDENNIIVTKFDEGGILHFFKFHPEQERIVKFSRNFNVDIRYNVISYEFSPNGNYLYMLCRVEAEKKSSFYRLEGVNSLGTGTTPKVVRLKGENYNNSNFNFQLQLAPNGKIYMSAYNAYHLSSIENPDSYDDIGYKYQAITLKSPSALGLPNIPTSFYNKIELPDSIFVCIGSTLELNANVKTDLNRPNYYWNGPSGFSSNLLNPSIDNVQLHNSGYYYLKASSNDNRVNYERRVYVQVVSEPNEKIIVFPDTLVCNLDSANLKIQDNYSIYEWTTGDSTNEISVTETGVYGLNYTDKFGCSGYSEVSVLFSNFKSVKIEGPTEICEGSEETLSAEGDYESYLWSNEDTTKTTQISEAGKYWLEVTTAEGCTLSDTIDITYHPNVIAELKPIPTTICEGDSVLLESKYESDYLEYLWSTNETTKSIYASETGTYKLTITDTRTGCMDNTEIAISVEDNLEPKIIGSNICEGETATLEALPIDPSYAYEWSNGETTPTIEVSQPATYTVTVSKNGCSEMAEFTVNESPNPVFEILGEGIICDNTTTLSPDKDFVEYLWSTDEVTKEIEVTEAGTYLLSVTDENGCSATEEFTVKEQSLSFDISKDRIDFGKVYISENATDSAKIINTSGFQITITDGTQDYIIPDGFPVEYTKTLNPTELGPYSDSFEYRVISPCDTVITIPVTAEVYAIATISSDNFETEIGKEESIPVYLKAEADLGEQTYTITTNVDQSVLYTEDDYTFTNTTPINEAKTKVHEINGTIMLANSLEYDITFPSYEFNNPYIEVATEQGSITIDSVCAFPLRNVTFIESTEMRVSPNPAKDKLVVDVLTGHFDKTSDTEPVEVGEGKTIRRFDRLSDQHGQQMTLELISSEGRVAYTENWTQTASEKQLHINTDKIPSGLYQVRLQTPSGVLTENVIVVR